MMNKETVGQIKSPLYNLPARHRAALEWFDAHAGTTQPWPKPLPDGTLLVSKAKGIYKPAWSDYALSIRQSLGGPYLDKEPITRPDGTWSYSYYQEGNPLDSRVSAYTNQGLIRCWHDQIPVGVLRQVKGKPNPAYNILGLARVTDWERGYFILESWLKNDLSPILGHESGIEGLLGELKIFNSNSITDGRERIIASIVLRRGQSYFRRQLITIYEGRCAITGYDLVEALEAAHIIPYKGAETNNPQNGLLLRADIHTLFDLGLISIDPNNMTVIISPRLKQTSYAALSGCSLWMPNDVRNQPSVEALAQHRTWAGI